MLKKFIKGCSIALILSLSLGAFSACGTKTDSADQTGTSTASGSTSAQASAKPSVKMETVRVWNNFAHSKDVMTKLVEEFNNGEGKEKGITIEYTVHGGDYAQTIDMALTSGQAPELFAKVAGAASTYVQKGNVIALDDMPGGPEFIKSFGDAVKNPSFMYEGKVYDVPYNVSNIKLLYNKELLKKAGLVDEKGEAKPPKTWAELREYAKKLTNPSEKVYGFGIPLKYAGYFNWELLRPFASSIGHEIFDHKTGKFNFADFKPVAEFIQGIYQDKSYFPGMEGLDNDQARAQFAEGRIAMKFGANWDVGVLNDQFPAKIEWGAADVPVLDVNKRYKEFASVNGCAVVSSTAKGKDLGKIMEVYKFLNSDKVLVKLYEESKSMPYKKDVVKLATKKPEKKGWDDFGKIDNIYLTIGTPSVKIEGEDHTKVFAKILLGTTPIDAALADLDKRYNAALENDVKNGTLKIDAYINPDFDISVK